MNRRFRRPGLRTWTAAIVVVLLVLAGCRGSSGPGADEARLRVDGAATVTTPDGDTEVVTDDDADVPFGSQVVVDAGTATLELAGGAMYELRAGDTPTKIEVGLPVVLLEGDLLVAEGFPAPVSIDTATVTANGAVKVIAEERVAAAYAGRARISGVGSVEAVRGLREIVLSPSATAEPFSYDGADAWDRRFLGEAMAFGERLEALGRGYTANLTAGGGRTESFFEAVIPALADEREFAADLLDPDRAPGETLIGAAIAVQGRDGTFRERWDEIFTFRDAGAAWGLVALDQGVSSAPLLETIELAIDDSPLVGDPSRPTTTTTRPDRPTSTTTSSPGQTTTSTTTTTTTTVPPGGPLDPVLDPVDRLLDDVLGALGLGGGD